MGAEGASTSARAGLAASLAWVEAPGAARAPDERPAVDAERGLLTPLSVPARMVALAVIGPCEPEPQEEEFGPTAAAPDAAAVWARLDRALDADEITGPSAREAEILWQRLVTRTLDAPLDAVVSSLRLALYGPHPLGVTEPADVEIVPPGRAREMFIVGLGLNAARGQRTAESVVRAILRGAEPEAAQVACAIKGLGEGLADAGLRWIARRARHAVADRRGLDAAAEPLSATLAGGHGDGVQRALTALETAERLAGRPAEQAYEELLLRWTEWPPTVRALLLRRASPKSEAARALWLADMSPQVILVGLGGLEGIVPEDVRERLLSLLDHPDPAVRQAVTTRLSRARAASPVIQAAPTAPRGELLTLPTTALARTPLDRLRAALSGDEPEAVCTLVSTLPEEAHEPARQALLNALDVPDVAVRRASVEALAAVARPEDATALLDAARRVRGLEGLVVKALRSIADTRKVEEVAQLFHRRLKWADDEAIDDFISLAGHRATPELVTALTTRFYPPARAGAARALARHDLKEAVFTLRTRSMIDPNADARRAALRSLQALTGSGPSHEETAGYALLISPIDDLDQATERAQLAGAAALPGLRTTLTKGSWRRRSAACEVLGGIQADGAEAALLDAMLDADEDVRMAARVALSARDWQPRTARDGTLVALAERRLDGLLDSPDQAHVPTLEHALQLGGHIFRTEVLETLDGLRRLGLWNPSPEVAAAVYTTQLEPRAALREADGLRTLLQAIDRTWQLHPHRTLLMTALTDVPPSALAALLSEREWGWRAREAVCMALGRPGDNGAIEALVRYVLDPDEDVRSAAVDGLVRIQTRDAAIGLARGAESPFQEDADAVARGLAAVGPMAVPAVQALAHSPWWEARRVAGLTLRDWRGDLQEAADITLTLAVDPEYRVAEVARDTLWRHGARPSPAAVRDALQRAQELSVGGLEHWLGLDAQGRLRDARGRALLGQIFATRAPDALPQRVGLSASLRILDARPWLEAAARGASTDHVGVRIASARALRALADATCRLCRGRGTVGCVACESQGDQRCGSCEGRGALKRPCPEPDCNARETTRSIRSRACKTCRGRGEVPRACDCAGGRVPCDLCHGTGRTVCLLCEGTGEAAAEPPGADEPQSTG